MGKKKVAGGTPLRPGGKNLAYMKKKRGENTRKTRFQEKTETNRRVASRKVNKCTLGFAECVGAPTPTTKPGD